MCVCVCVCVCACACMCAFCIPEVFTRKCLDVFDLAFYIEGHNDEDYLNVSICKGSQQGLSNESP